MRYFVSYIVVFVILSLAMAAQAQTNIKSHDVRINIPEVALLDLESSSPSIALNLKAPNEAGNSVDFSNVNNSELWINYSSVTSSSLPDRKVSAFIEGEIPEGVKLNVSASSYTGSGAGKTGIPAGTITLTNNMQDIITQIGSCYTGDGVNNGHQLTYSLTLDEKAGSYADLSHDQSGTISVTYILTDLN